MARQRDRIVPRLIEDEMKQSFLDYSMSVIVQRALPDVRDGLKPVHRRILYSMHEAGLSPARPFKKSATVVGDVLGKYHPHGDTAVYDALVRMVQEFSLRYPLVAGQGNFGSIDGDMAAAYRYTEARLSPVAMEMLSDIDKDTVDFVPNFDDRLQEPTVLPAKVPNLLINGSSGIAVGMSTNIPPHNAREVFRAAIHLLDHPECTIDDLMRIVPGPDFPTGGLIMGKEGIEKAYHTGRGRVVMQARIGKEVKRGGREQLVVTEIPYATSKSRIIEQIAELTKKGKIGDISDLRDESDRDGIRLVIELKRGADSGKVVRSLLKWTALQATFGVISLALDNGVPREFTLKEMLERFRDHRVEVVVARSRWELGKARDEAHLLEGLLVALKHIDRVVKIIRGSRQRETAAEKLRTEFKLSERQAEAILQMRLYRLTQLETKELRDRLAALEKRIRELEAILASPKRQIAEVRAELEELLEKYGDARRTRIVAATAKTVVEDLVAQEDVVVTLSHEGYVKQIPLYLYRRRLSAGKGLAGMDRYENDYLEHVFTASTADVLMFCTEDGQAHWLGVSEIPETGATSRGKPLHQLLGLPKQARISALLAPSRQPEDAMLVFSTEQGLVKRTPLSHFASQRGGGVAAIVLRQGDRLLGVDVSDGAADVVLVSRLGRVILFPETEVPEMGRVAQGVRGLKLAASDRVVGAIVARREASVCAVTEKGFVFRMPLSEFAAQKRDGRGTATFAAGGAVGRLVTAKEWLPGDDLMVTTSGGATLRVTGEEIGTRVLGEAGEQLVPLKRGEVVVDVARVASREDDEDDDAEATTDAGSVEATVTPIDGAAAAAGPEEPPVEEPAMEEAAEPASTAESDEDEDEDSEEEGPEVPHLSITLVSDQFELLGG